MSKSMNEVAAVYYDFNAYGRSGNIMGRQAAGNDFMKAYLTCRVTGDWSRAGEGDEV